MSFNGSGVFNINTAGQPVVTGTTISSTTFNNLTADLATGLTTTLTKDGQSTPTANIGLGTYKIVNLGAGTVASDAARLDQVQGGAATFITVTGTDTLTGTVSPALSAYAAGNQFSFLVANTNTGAVTINVDGIGSKAITRTGTTALVAGDMVAGQAVEIIYDGTRFQLVNGNSFTNLKVSGTLAVTGVATFTAQPIVSSLTASLPVFTDASKGLVSNTMTGTGNVVMSASPTFTGTVGAVDITTTGNTILGNASTDTLNVGNGGLVKDASGNVGIGTASPAHLLDVVGGGARAKYLQVTNGGYAGSGATTPELYSPSAGTLAISANGGERMRIDTSGNLLLGSTSATGTGALRGSYGTGGITSNFAAGDGALNANTTGIQNTAVGYTSLNTNTTGNNNQAFGYQTLFSNLSGSSNTAMGLAALYWNTASNNTAVGFQAMQGASGTSTGASNAALGYQALTANTTGTNNSALGYQALFKNTTATDNVGIGTYALYQNTTGINNSAIGGSALENNVTGSYNVAVGNLALYWNTASNNTAVGHNAMKGASGTSTGANNAALGYQALYANTTGNSNVAVGHQSLNANTTAAQLTGVGYHAGYACTGGGNTFIGYTAGESKTSGSGSIYIGNAAGSTSTTGDNNVLIGNSVRPSAITNSSELVIHSGFNLTGKGSSTAFISGNGGATYNGANTTTFATTSDQRLKKNIVDNNTGLGIINQIQVRNFEYRLASEVTDLPEHTAINIQGTQLGPIAQELQLVLPQCVKTESTGVMSVDVSDLTWYLVNAVKELTGQVTLLTARVKQLEGK